MSGLGGIFTGILGGGNVSTNWQTPQINTVATDEALGQLQTGPNAGQTQALSMASQMAQGQGPSAAQALLNQQANNITGQSAALAASGSGSAGAGLARRQAMMTGAAAQQQVGNQLGVARAQEQVGALGALGNLSSTVQQQGNQAALGAAGLQAGLATNQAGLQQQTNQLTAGAQGANQTAGNNMMQNVMGGIEGAGMLMAGSDPAMKTEISDAEEGGKEGKSQTPPQMSVQDMVRQKHFGLYKPGTFPPATLSSPPDAKTDVKPAYKPGVADALVGFAGGFSGQSPKDLASVRATLRGEKGSPEDNKQPASTPAHPSLSLPHIAMNPQVATVSSPPEAKQDVAPADNRPEVRMPQIGEYVFGTHDIYKESSPRGYALPPPATDVPEMTVDASDDDSKPYMPPKRLIQPDLVSDMYGPRKFEDSIPDNPHPLTDTYFDSDRLRGFFHPEVVPEPAYAAREATLPAKTAGVEPIHRHSGPAKQLWVSPQERAKAFQGSTVTSDPQQKEGVGGDTVEDALRNLHPYSYRYKDPRNEPIPNPTGGERFFGIMTTDLKKHPVTASLVSGAGGQERVSVPAATSFALASVAHLQRKIDALTKMFGGKGGGRE